MNENEIKIAESFNILDKCQKLEKDFLRLSRITKVEFDLNGLYDNIYHDNIYQVIILVKYEIPMELGPKKYFRIRTNILKKVFGNCTKQPINSNRRFDRRLWRVFLHCI